MASVLPPKGPAIALALELRRLCWSQHQLAQTSQLRPEIISRLMTGKVTMPYAETRKKILVALRRRAEELKVAPPNEVKLFPTSGEPVAYHEQWQETLVGYARCIRWAKHLTDELEPLYLLRLRFELAGHEVKVAPSETLEQWEKAADVVYYAAQRARQGEPEALLEAQTNLSHAHISWKKAIVAALARYAIRNKQIEKETEQEWQSITCSLQALQEQSGENSITQLSVGETSEVRTDCCCTGPYSTCQSAN